MVLVLMMNPAINLFFKKIKLSKFSLSVEEIESHETLSKTFSGSAVAFQWEIGKGLCVNEDKDSQ